MSPHGGHVTQLVRSAWSGQRRYKLYVLQPGHLASLVLRRAMEAAASGEASSAEHAGRVHVQDYRPPSTFSSDMKVLRSMWFGSISGETQEERLQSFYAEQSEQYDSYRCRMLHGRLPMATAIAPIIEQTPGCVMVDLGGGTASNLEFFRDSMDAFSRIVVVDLCQALVDEARKRVEKNGWQGTVDVLHGDATDTALAGLPEPGTVDVVTFSYALTMMPWRAALRNAWTLLKPGGILAVADFTVHESQWPGMATIFKSAFKTDDVFPSEEHIPTLQASFDEVHHEVGYGSFPYVPPVVQCPWYVFVGRKTSDKEPPSEEESS